MIITGDRGFIGKHLTKQIDGYGIDIKQGKDILNCDLPESDTIIHLAAQTSVVLSVNAPIADAKINIIGTIRLARKYKKARFIFASSGGAIQEKIESPYGLSKFCGEEYIKMICDDYIILRFPNIYGSGSNSVVDKFKNDTVNIYGDGTATRDYVHVNDLIRAIKMSLTWESGTYQLGSGKNVSVQQLAEATGKQILYKDKREGELQHSKVKNTAPDWKPEIDVLEYISNA